MNNKYIFFTFALGLLFIQAYFFPSVILAAGECAHVEAYILNLDTNQGIPGSSVLLRCRDTFDAGGVKHQCTEGGASYGSCWENSGWRDVPTDGHVFFNPDGYDCLVGNPMLEVRLPPGWTHQCSTDGSKYNCSSGSNVDTNNLQVINGGGFVFKVFYSPPTPAPTPTPTPTPRSTPTPTPTPRSASTPTPTPRPAATPTPTPTPAPTPTSSPTATPTPTPISTPTPTPTSRPAVTPTPTPIPASTPTPTPKPIVYIQPTTPPQGAPEVVYTTPTPTPKTLPNAGDSTSVIVTGTVGTVLVLLGSILLAVF